MVLSYFFQTTPTTQHNGHHSAHHAAAAAAAAHAHVPAAAAAFAANPWLTHHGAEAAAAAHWAMHPANLYPAAAAAAVVTPPDLKPDVKPHSPGDFQTSVSAAAIMTSRSTPQGAGSAGSGGTSSLHHSWNPPVSSPYLGMASPPTPGAAAPPPPPGHPPPTMPVAPNSPSPLQHHPAYGMNGMLPGQMPPHPFADRYHRESHNSSPRSGTDEDGMHTPTSGTYQILHIEIIKYKVQFFRYLWERQTSH